MDTVSQRKQSTNHEEREARNAEMYRLYTDELWTFKGLADEFGLNSGHIGNIFRERGWPCRPSGSFPLDEVIMAIRDRGYRVVKLAPVGDDSIGWVITEEWGSTA